MKKLVILAAVSMMLGAWGSTAISGDVMTNKSMDMKKDSMETMKDDSMEKEKMRMNDSIKMDTMKKKPMEKDKIIAGDSM